jgi:hypothetical protein
MSQRRGFAFRTLRQGRQFQEGILEKGGGRNKEKELKIVKWKQRDESLMIRPSFFFSQRRCSSRVQTKRNVLTQLLSKAGLNPRGAVLPLN